MPLTRDDWRQWSLEKRKFYATLITCYHFEGGVLCVDEQKRLQFVRDQLQKQTKEVEKIIVRPVMVKYIIADGLQRDGLTLKAIEEVERIRVLCLKQKVQDPRHREHEKRVLLGGHFPDTSTVPLHFERHVKSKMCNSIDQMAATIAKDAIFREIDRIEDVPVDDLTVFSYFSTHPDELTFLLDDELVLDAIRNEASRLITEMGLRLLPTVLEKEIRRHIECSSRQVELQTSLANLSAPSVHTHVVLYTVKAFSAISKCVSGITSRTSQFDYSPVSGDLCDYVSHGPLIYSSLPEYSNLLRVLLFFGRFANKSLANTDDDNPLLVSATVLDMLLKISEKQINSIKTGDLPLPPVSMGASWDPRLALSDTLTILRRIYGINLYTVAEMVTVAREDAPAFFGLHSLADIDKLNGAINGLWDSQMPELEQGIERYFEEQQKINWAQVGVKDVTLLNTEARVQPSGIHLGRKIFGHQDGPGTLSLFAKDSDRRKALMRSYEEELLRSYGPDGVVFA